VPRVGRKADAARSRPERSLTAEADRAGHPGPAADEPAAAAEDTASEATGEDISSQQPAEAVAEYVPLSDPVRDYLDAIERTEAQSSAYSSELSDLYLGLGQHHLDRQEFDEARKAFLRGLQITRVNNGLYATEQTHFMFSIADIESRMGELAAAEEIYTEIIAALPGFSEGWNRRATVRFYQRDFEGSLADIEQTLRLEPRHFGAIWGLGMILGSQRDFQRAILAFERLLEIKPNARDAPRRIELLKQELAKESV